MANLQNPVDPNATGRMDDFPVFEEGEYQAMLVDERQTDRGLSFEFTMMGQPYDGLKLFENANIFGEETWQVEKGNKFIAALARAVGIHTALTNTDILMGKTYWLKVTKVKSKKGDGREFNNIADVFDPQDTNSHKKWQFTGQAQASEQPQPQQQPQQQPQPPQYQQQAQNTQGGAPALPGGQQPQQQTQPQYQPQTNQQKGPWA